MSAQQDAHSPLWILLFGCRRGGLAYADRAMEPAYRLFSRAPVLAVRRQASHVLGSGDLNLQAVRSVIRGHDPVRAAGNKHLSS
jgi:hypothetical protein